MPSFRLPKKKARECTLPAAIKVEQTQKIEDMWGLISENFHWSSYMISIYRWFSCGSHVLCSTCQPKDVEEKEAKIKNPSGYLKAYPKSGNLRGCSSKWGPYHTSTIPNRWSRKLHCSSCTCRGKRPTTLVRSGRSWQCAFNILSMYS